MMQAADSWTWESLPKSIFAPKPNRMPRPTKEISTLRSCASPECANRILAMPTRRRALRVENRIPSPPGSLAQNEHIIAFGGSVMA